MRHATLSARSRRLPRALLAPVLLGCLLAFDPVQAGVLLIGHLNLPKLDDETVLRLYTGKLIEIHGMSVIPVNAKPGLPLRQHFLKAFMNQDEEQYSAYWIVRRHIGKGNPPRELATSGDIIRYVENTPGAIGYIDEADLVPGLNILARKKDEAK
jgi:hypothetical protein